jgi:hypothetical protein
MPQEKTKSKPFIINPNHTRGCLTNIRPHKQKTGAGTPARRSFFIRENP